MKNTTTYNFKNGNFKISKLKFDWFLECELNNDKEGNKQFIFLDRKIFLTKKGAKEYIEKLLNKYKLI